MNIIFLYILLGLALLIALILSLRVNLHIVYQDELKVYCKILFFKIQLLPAKNVKFNPKKYEKMLKGEAKNSANILNELKEENKKLGIIDSIKKIADFVSSLLKAFAPHMHVKLAKVHVKIASNDAAKTAIIYGAVSGAVACLIDAIDDFTNLKKLKRKSVIIEPDFLSEKTQADIHAVLSISIYGAIATVFKLVMDYTINKNKNGVFNTMKGK